MNSTILKRLVKDYLRDHIGQLPKEVSVIVEHHWPDKWSVYIWFDMQKIWGIEKVHYESVLDVLDLEHLFIAEKIRAFWAGKAWAGV